jgi:flagellar basal body-associated protein FliL
MQDEEKPTLSPKGSDRSRAIAIMVTSLAVLLAVFLAIALFSPSKPYRLNAPDPTPGSPAATSAPAVVPVLPPSAKPPAPTGQP